MLIIFVMIKLCLTIIKFDTNYFEQWSIDITSGFLCYGGAKYDNTIQFSDSFVNIPQVFITHELFGMHWTQAYPISGFNFSISDITLTDFVIHLHCQYERNYRFKIRWFAVDDQRIQVISQFNLIPPQNCSYYYANVNCDKYFLTITSLNVIGPTDVQLDVQFTPPNTVTVVIPYIEGFSENLKSIGFQLILGIDQAFSQSQTIYTNSNYDSLVYDPIQIDQVEFYPFSGFAFQNQYLLELFVNSLSDGSGIRYQMYEWGAGYTPNFHKKVRVSKSITKMFSPILCNFLRFSQKLEFRDLPRPMFSIEFTEDQDVYISNGYRTISKSITNLNLIIKCNCITGKKIQSKFLKCENCFKKNYQFEHFCYGAINLLFINARFITQTNAIQELSIELTTNSCKITQLIYNQKYQPIVIVDIKMIDS
ncbi:unnamed protein product [Paramecium sonneborni]|uniref:H-type lectin domain-containing protein n=1 Tax=Paramecium sonneborni TaxID=65129 RepID=A0A8S1RKQ2_9CILI|nr:unnamed protein product [Paramecium sonneborni]